jgi:hypothetical protein
MISRRAFRSGKVRENLGTYECVPTRAPPSPNTVSSRRPVDASVCPPVFAPAIPGGARSIAARTHPSVPRFSPFYVSSLFGGAGNAH